MRNWYPYGIHLAEGNDFTPWHARSLLHLSERLVCIFKDEIQELNIVMWEQQDTDDYDGQHHVEVVAFGADGYASKLKLGDWLRGSFQVDDSVEWHGQREARLKALRALREDIEKIISGFEAKNKSEPTE